MKNTLYTLILFTAVISSCERVPELNDNSPKLELYAELFKELNGPTCPKNHQDSIVPIVYGYPSEELFAKADSGLVVLGGCELDDPAYYCKIHQLSF